MKRMHQLKNNEELSQIVELIFSNNPLQKKRITKFFSSKKDEVFWLFCDNLSKTLNTKLLISEKDKDKAAAAYIKMCKDFLSEQIKFKRTGEYSCLDASDANTNVYSDPEVMRYYMVGLLLSYMFWPNHYELFQFYRENLPVNRIENYLEVGVGHGLFTSTMLSHQQNVKPTIVDISETSINTAIEVMRCFDIDTSEINFVHNDYLDTEFNDKFDFIIMGEVLEHVNDAPLFMQKTKKLLKPDGTIYLSTCANSPALDHVYRFHNVQEMRDIITNNGFSIVKDLALPSEDIPEQDWEKELVTINYCALIKHE